MNEVEKVAKKLLSTTDARIWAEEFCNLFSIAPREERVEPLDTVGLMIGWFANAIETGRDNGRIQLFSGSCEASA